MFEVRSSYLVAMKDVRAAGALSREAREQVLPALGWQGRVQQMLHGHAQQSVFVWSSEWDSIAAWEAAMARVGECREYREWARKWQALDVRGEETEIFEILEPWIGLDNSAGKIEVRSGYLVSAQNRDHARMLAENDQQASAKLHVPIQSQLMVVGKAAQSMFVFVNIYASQAEYEQGIAGLGSRDDFFDWWKQWTETVEVGGPREIFRNQ